MSNHTKKFMGYILLGLGILIPLVSVYAIVVAFLGPPLLIVGAISWVLGAILVSWKFKAVPKIILIVSLVFLYVVFYFFIIASAFRPVIGTIPITVTN